MPVVHDLDDLFGTTDAIVDVIGFAQKAPNIGPFAMRHPDLREICQRFRTIDQVIAESNRCRRIIAPNESHDLDQSRSRPIDLALGARSLFSSPSADVLADTLDRNTLAGVELSSCSIK